MNQGVLQQAIAQLNSGHGRAAAELALDMLQQQPGNLQAMAIAGAALGQSGDYNQARYWLQQLLQRQPDNIHALINLAQVCGHLRQPDAAIGCLQRVLQLQANNHRARLQLARALQQNGQPVQAQAQLQQLLQTNPDHLDALAMQAELNQSRGHTGQARQGYLQVLQQQPGHVVASLGLAALELNDGAAADALHRLEQLLQHSQLSARNEAIARQRMGMAQQSLGEYALAFAAFQHANSLLQNLPECSLPRDSESTVASSVYATGFIRRLLSDVQVLPNDQTAARKTAARTAASTPTTSAAATRIPLFLMGFPRSGTTLLEQMLIAHPDIDSVEENDNLADLHDLLLQANKPLQTVMALPPEQLEEYRRSYWQRLDAVHAQTGEAHAQAGVVIDKLPLNSVLLPVIAVLFPEAKILFAVRDPRAVVFSCWQQLFDLNEAMVHFLSLQDSVAYYDLVMQLASASLARLPVDCLLLRHETLLQQPEKTLREVLAFIDQPWNEQVLDHRQRGGNRFIDTPSAQQIRKPLNQAGTQRWRHYAELLPEEFKQLDDWARHWGYAG
ncbi:MAG: sulfotransferase [Gammaproteobacteria bacterium]|nr:sulfotransferase [Gammaproteobacteria bacterium]